jgi:hypothetical protein
MVEVQQRFPAVEESNLVSAIRRELNEVKLSEKVKPGATIAITAGSRGIANYPEILATVVDEVKRAGGIPFLIPSMGSHGGATPEGQVELLKSLNITPGSVGAPIHATMEVDEVAKLDDGTPIYIDRYALGADGIIVIGRVKPHTDFKETIESGLMKMMVIGLGKQKGAEMIHRHQSEGYHRLLPLAAKIIVEKVPILLGLAVVENAYHRIAIVKAVEPQDIEREEVKLLEKAKQLIARLPFHEIDVPEIRRIVVLDLSEQTHGSAIGMGLADVTTQRVISKIDYQKTFVNVLTAGWPEVGKTPVFLPNDRDAIAAALGTIGLDDPREAKVVRIKNTQELEKIWISESLLNTVKDDLNLQKTMEVLGDLREMQFDVLGTIAR